MTAGRRLGRLRDALRNWADYDDHRTITRMDATWNVQEAERPYRHSTRQTVDPIRTQITDATKVYERDVLKDVTWHTLTRLLAVVPARSDPPGCQLGKQADRSF